MASQFEADPELRHAIDQLHGPLGEERRGTCRALYPAVQHIAEATGEGVPEKTAFVSVQCHDLSTRGFSFVAKQRPPFDSLVLALGTPLGVIHVAAEVRHCNEALEDAVGHVEVLPSDAAEAAGQGSHGTGAKPVVLVGCEFTGRLESGNS